MQKMEDARRTHDHDILYTNVLVGVIVICWCGGRSQWYKS